MNLQQIWEAGRVARWHQHPKLSNSGDFIDAHSARVARLLIALFNPSANLLIAALTHDDPELFTGDMSRPAKEANHHEWVKIEQWGESRAIEMWGRQILPDPDLDHWERAQLYFCDKLDGLMWLRHCRPERWETESTVKHRRELLDLARDLGIREIVKGILS